MRLLILPAAAATLLLGAAPAAMAACYDGHTTAMSQEAMTLAQASGSSATSSQTESEKDNKLPGNTGTAKGGSPSLEATPGSGVTGSGTSSGTTSGTSSGSSGSGTTSGTSSSQPEKLPGNTGTATGGSPTAPKKDN